MLERALIDYYRCPEELVKMSLSGELSTDSGYFRFGPSICYGQSAFGSRASRVGDGLDDVAPAVRAEAGLLRVPFDPSQVVDNLRLERYVTGSESWQKALYYAVRPFIPPPLRRRLQRSYFRHWTGLTFPRWPVDDTVDRILEHLLRLSLESRGADRVPFVWFWPDGASSCAMVTHDVETAAGRDRCGWLMDVDDSYGIKASFQIVPEARYAIPPGFLDAIRRRGFEINLHDLNHDGRLFTERGEFERRAQRIGQYRREFGARGFRSGQLYRNPDWYEALDVDYDMSIPNTAHLEIQRGGCCTVMPYMIGRIVELPLTTTQDYSLFHILKDFHNGVWETQLEAILGRHGFASFITHPDYLDGEPAQESYRALLGRLRHLRNTEGCWVALPGEVERWWRARCRMTVVREGDRWRVEGEGKERARVAYAELAGDALVYRLAEA